MSGLEASPDCRLGLCSGHCTIFMCIDLKAWCDAGLGTIAVVTLVPAGCIVGETVLLHYLCLSPGRSAFHRIQCSETLKEHTITSFRLNWETLYGPDEFVREGPSRWRELLDQKHRSEKTSNGTAEAGGGKLALIKAMVRTALS